MNETVSKVRNYIDPHLNNSDISNDDDFYTTGAVNSLLAMQILMYLEKEFAIKFGTEDLVITKMNTVNKLAALVDRKVSDKVLP